MFVPVFLVLVEHCNANITCSVYLVSCEFNIYSFFRRTVLLKYEWRLFIYNEPITADMAKALYWKQNGRDFYAGDKVNNISFYNGSNFADLQNVVVNWGSPWTCDMAEGSYPVFDGTLADGINKVENIAKGKIFNINGIQVEKTTKGLYIIDGKKVMVK